MLKKKKKGIYRQIKSCLFPGKGRKKTIVLLDRVNLHVSGQESFALLLTTVYRRVK